MNKQNLPIFTFVQTPEFLGYEGQGSGAGAGGESGTQITMDQVTTAINNTVNSAMANMRKNDLPAAIRTALDPLNTQFTSINEALARLTGGGNSNAGGGNGDGGQGGNQGGQGGQAKGEGGGNSGIPPELASQLRTLHTTVQTQGTQISALTKDRDAAVERAGKMERDSAVRTALSGIDFASADAQNTALLLLNPLVEKLDDGTFVAGKNNLPANEFAKDFFSQQHSYLLKPTGTSGSGANAGSGNGSGSRQRSGARADMSEIGPNMSAETRAKVLAEIEAALPQQPN